MTTMTQGYLAAWDTSLLWGTRDQASSCDVHPGKRQAAVACHPSRLQAPSCGLASPELRDSP